MINVLRVMDDFSMLAFVRMYKPNGTFAHQSILYIPYICLESVHISVLLCTFPVVA